jgi:hypothetical protein
MKVCINVEFNGWMGGLLQEIGTDGNLIEWSCPVLPRSGEYFCNTCRFLSEDVVAVFKKREPKMFPTT